MTRQEAATRVQEVWQSRPRELRAFPNQMTREQFARVVKRSARKYEIHVEMYFEVRDEKRPAAGWRTLTLLEGRSLDDLVTKFTMLARSKGWKV